MMRILLGTALMVLTCAAQAAAGETATVAVPEPTTLALISAGVAALTVGTRWFRRK